MAKRTTRPAVPLAMDLDGILHATPLETGGSQDAQVREFFRAGEFFEEKYLVQAIERHLLTAEQRRRLFAAGLSINKMLNGDVSERQEPVVDRVFAEWNHKLGHRQFGG